jgi:hypothetical protein
VKFFKTVQNKLHWAITGHTAAELIADRVNSAKPNMGLTHWKNAPRGKVLKSDVTVAKNYLNEKEIKELERVYRAWAQIALFGFVSHRDKSLAQYIKVG